MYVPTPPSRKPYWVRAPWGAYLIMAFDGKGDIVLKTVSKQEYFKLKLSNKTDDVLKKCWEKWRKGDRPLQHVRGELR